MRKGKIIHVPLDEKTGKELDEAYQLAYEESGKKVRAPDIVLPAVKGFIRAAKEGRAMEYLAKLPRK